MRLYVVPPAKKEFHEFMLISEDGDVIASHLSPHGDQEAYEYFKTCRPVRQRSCHVVKLGFDNMTREELLRRNKIKHPEEIDD